MSNNNLDALKLINGLLILFTQGAKAIAEINSLLVKAHAEGRDITDEELKGVQEKTDALHADVMEKLKGIAQQ